MAYIIDIANNLFLTELDSPDNITVASIAAFLRANVGKLNILIGRDYIVDSNQEISENGVLITDKEGEILSKLFLINYFTRQIKSFLGVGGVESVQSLESDGGRIQMFSKTNVAQNYIALRKEVSAELKTLLNNYKFSNGRASQVVGDDVLTDRIPPISPQIPYVRNSPNNSSGNDIL